MTTWNSFNRLLLLVLVFHLPVGAQTPGRLQPSDTSSVKSTLSSFLDACNEFYEVIEESEGGMEHYIPAADRMLDCLNLSHLPDELRDSGGIESAVYLKEVMDRIVFPELDQVPTDNEPLQEGREFRWRIPGTRLTIEKVMSGSRRGEYLFASETVKQAAKLYGAAKSLPYREAEPETSPGLRQRFVALTKSRPRLSADTSSPRGTLTLFLNTANEIYEIIHSNRFVDRTDPKYLPIAQRLISCLDTSQLPEYSRDYFASEAAVCLKEVLDRIPIPPPEQIPGPENIQTGSDTEKLVRWQIPNTQITIARVDEGPRRGEYLFTSGTVDRVQLLFAKIRKEPPQTGREVSTGFYAWYLSAPANETISRLIDRLPKWFRNRMLGLAVWQAIGLVLLLLSCLAIVLLVYRCVPFDLESSQRTLSKNLLTLLFPVACSVTPLLFSHLAAEYLTLRGTALYIAEFCANIAFLTAIVFLILAVSRRIAESFVAFPRIHEHGLDAQLIRILCRMAGIVVATIVFLEGGRYLGFPITTLLASAGIGGIAVALSAQGMLKGLFGTVTILLDRPFRVGERIIVNGHDGFVEEIGLRSTKIRTFLSNHLVSIPNDQIADAEIENIGRRDHIRRMLDLHIPLDTPRAKVENAVSEVRRILKDHQGMDPELPPRVFFNDFNPDSFNIRVIYWFHPPNLWDYLEFSESVNLGIFEAFEAAGIQFSLPLRHTYWKHDDQQGPLEVEMIKSEGTPNSQG